MKPSIYPSTIHTLHKDQLLNLIEEAANNLKELQKNELNEAIVELREDLLKFFRSQLVKLITPAQESEPDYDAIQTISRLLKTKDVDTLCQNALKGKWGSELAEKIKELLTNPSLAQEINRLDQLHQNLQSKDGTFFYPENLKQQIDAMWQELIETDEEIKKQESAADQLAKSLKEHEQSVSDLPDEIATLEEKLESQKHHEQNLLQQLEQIRANITQLEGRLTTKQSRAEAAEKKQQDITKEEQLARKTANEARTKKSELEQKIEGHQATYDQTLNERAELFTSARKALRGFLKEQAAKNNEQNDEPQNNRPPEANEEFKGKRVLLAMGDAQKLNTKYEQIMEELGIQFTRLGFTKRTLSSTISGEGYDAVLMVIRTLAGTMARDTVALAKSSGIPLIAIDSTNVEQIRNQLLSELME